jgi:molybdopterin/thiamine biosynthesis adenylyltransferase
MARAPFVTAPAEAVESLLSAAATQSGARLRAGPAQWRALVAHLTSRYPHAEWGTFAQFGWRDTPEGLVLSLAALVPPAAGDLDLLVDIVAFQEPYILRAALGAEQHPLAMGVIHSHPQGYRTWPSALDDDMDSYLAEYLGDFAPGRPYVSLIIALDLDGSVRASGRVYWRGTWQKVAAFSVLPELVARDAPPSSDVAPHSKMRVSSGDDMAGDDTLTRGALPLARVARLAAAFGEQAAERLEAATVAVIGAGGTGSPVIEVLARAGVGRLILVDPDTFSASNLERVHGTEARDVPLGDTLGVAKVALARRHIHQINPACKVIVLQGRLPQAEVLDAVLHAHVVVGCTDQQHSRVALSDLAFRYVIPVLDIGVSLEGADGHVTAQVVQLTRWLPHDPCVYCRKMVDPARLARELASPAERAARQAAAAAAVARGEDANPYWRDDPQLLTVGYLTTTAGAMAAGYVIGWLTGRFLPPFEQLQFDLAAPWLNVTDTTATEVPPRPDCSCRRVHGWADQGVVDALITPPAHWRPVSSPTASGVQV